jgi:hypothetical protein
MTRLATATADMPKPASQSQLVHPPTTYVVVAVIVCMSSNYRSLAIPSYSLHYVVDG